MIDKILDSDGPPGICDTCRAGLARNYLNITLCGTSTLPQLLVVCSHVITNAWKFSLDTRQDIVVTGRRTKPQCPSNKFN